MLINSLDEATRAVPVYSMRGKEKEFGGRLASNNI
jgi:hypothetical protein